jgi:hypothetical protein
MRDANITQAAGQSSGVVLSLEGARQFEAQRRALMRREAEEIIESSLDLVERLLRMLDQLDPDPEMEPALGWPNAGQMTNEAMATDGDREIDNADYEDADPGEDNGDDEPCVTDFGHDADYMGA